MSDQTENNEMDNAYGPPPYDSKLVGRLASRVQIRDVELLGAQFERADAGPLPQRTVSGVPNSLGISVGNWEAVGGLFGCLLSFFADFSDSDEEEYPYRVVATFRLTYELQGEDPEDDEADQFINWNGVFNAWPYWREYLSSTINRAGLERFHVPVMGLPGSASSRPTQEPS